MNTLLFTLPVKYIIAIIGLSIFAVLCVIFLVDYIKLKKHDEEQQKKIDELYSGLRAGKPDYECTVYDKETEEKIKRFQEHREGQMTIDDVMPVSSNDSDTLIGKFDNEGMEEITGSYKPE